MHATATTISSFINKKSLFVIGQLMPVAAHHKKYISFALLSRVNTL